LSDDGSIWGKYVLNQEFAPNKCIMIRVYMHYRCACSICSIALQFKDAKTQSTIRANADHRGGYAKQNW
jgi:hypothetical protein